MTKFKRTSGPWCDATFVSLRTKGAERPRTTEWIWISDEVMEWAYYPYG